MIEAQPGHKRKNVHIWSNGVSGANTWLAGGLLNEHTKLDWRLLEIFWTRLIKWAVTRGVSLIHRLWAPSMWPSAPPPGGWLVLIDFLHHKPSDHQIIARCLVVIISYWTKYLWKITSPSYPSLTALCRESQSRRGQRSGDKTRPRPSWVLESHCTLVVWTPSEKRTFGIPGRSISVALFHKILTIRTKFPQTTVAAAAVVLESDTPKLPKFTFVLQLLVQKSQFWYFFLRELMCPDQLKGRVSTTL